MPEKGGGGEIKIKKHPTTRHMLFHSTNQIGGLKESSEEARSFTYGDKGLRIVPMYKREDEMSTQKIPQIVCWGGF